MKNLKKILVALALVAVLVSSIVTVAIADASYSGTVEQALELLAKAEEATGSDKVSIADAKAGPLAELYDYAVKNPIDPKAEGYDDAINAYNALTFKVAYIYSLAVRDAATDEEKASVLADLYVYLAKAPVYKPTASYDCSIYLGYRCNDEECGKYYDFTDAQLLGADTSFSCSTGCGGTDVVLTNEYKYSDFEKDVNNASLSIAGLILENLIYASEDTADKQYVGYYDVVAVKYAIENFTKNVLELDHDAPESLVYNGELDVVEGLLDTLTEESDVNEVKEIASAIHSYMITNPINPTTDEYLEFISVYYELCDLVVEKQIDYMNTSVSAEEKIARLAEFRDYLVANPLSKGVVNDFNSIRASLIEEFENSESSLTDEIAEVEITVPVLTYSDGYEEFAALVEALYELPYGDANIPFYMEELYAKFTGVVYDPMLSTAPAILAKYNTAVSNYVRYVYVDGMNDLDFISDKYTMLVEFRKYIEENPVPSGAVDVYNEAREILLEEAKTLSKKINSDNLPIYAAPDKAESTVNVSTLTKRYAAFENALLAYQEALYEGVSVDEAFDAMLGAAKALYTYISGSVFNTDDAYYATFESQYSYARSEFVALILGAVDIQATPEAQLDMLAKVGEYLASAPVSREAVELYNAKVESLVDDAALKAEMILDNSYFTIDKVYEYAMDASLDIDTRMEAMLVMKDCLDRLLDVTDPAYAKAYSDYEVAAASVAVEMERAIAVALNELTVEEAVMIIQEYRNFVNVVYTPATVQSFRKAVKSTADTCENIIKKIEANDDAVAGIVSDNDKAEELIGAFVAAESVEERYEAFAELYNKLHGEYFTAAFMAGESYYDIQAVYEIIFAAFEAELIDLININQAPDVLCENLIKVREFIIALPFSETVANEFNAVLEAAKSVDYSEYAKKLESESAPLVYAVPDGWTANFARVELALEMATRGENVSEEFYVAYKIIGGIAGVDGPKPVDFGDEAFYDVLETFDDVKNQLVSQYMDAVLESVPGSNENIEALVSLAEFATAYPFSSRLVDFYNEQRLEIVASLEETSVSLLDPYASDFEVLHNHLAAAPIQKSLLDSISAEKYDALMVAVEAFEYFELEGFITKINTIDVENALIYKNIAFDKINWYKGEYRISALKDSDFADATLMFAFEKLLKAFDGELEALSADEKEEKIDRIGRYFVNSGYSASLINIYNDKYGTSLAPKAMAISEGKGNFAILGEYISAFDSSEGFDNMRMALSEAIEYIVENPFSTENRETEMNDKINAASQMMDEENALQMIIADESAPLSEYDRPMEHYYTHDDGKIYKSSLSQQATDPDAKNVINKEANGNSYAEFSVTKSSSPYYNMILSGTEMGVVIEFDIMSYGDLNFKLTFTQDGLNYGERVTTNVFLVKNSQLEYIFGDYSNERDDEGYPGYQKGVHDPITFTPGQWTHIALAMDVEALEMELSINYVSLGRKPIITAASSSKIEDTCKFTELRFQNSAYPTVTCYDNVLTYSGTAYRNLDKFTTMENEDRFNYYVDYALDSSRSAVDRLYAYYAAEALINLVGDECDEYKAKFEAFDVSEIKYSAHDAHIENLNNIVKNINVDEMTTGTATDMGVAIDTAEKYIDENRLYIDQASEEFVKINDLLIAAKEKNVWLDDLGKLLTLISRFHRATSYASLTKHFTALKEYYDLCELDKPEKLLLAEKDPMVINFVSNMSVDPSVVKFVSDLTLGTYYNVYIPARINEQLCSENSLKIIDCIGFVEILVEDREGLTDSEYYAKLLEAASENSEYVDPYMTVIRNIVNADLYDPSTEGIARAIEIFNILDQMFFEALQAEHFGVIQSKFDRYSETDSYIEKAGICTFVENYIIENNVDMSGAQGTKYLYELALYKAELEEYKLDYEAVLAANTVAFLGTVKKMEAYASYAEIKPLYDEAINNYYYSMNADSDEVKAAIEKFAVYEAMIEEWEYNSSMFIGYVENLNTAMRQSHKYRALVNCTMYIDGIDIGVEGVSDALNSYVTQLAEYNEYINTVNGEVNEAIDIGLALRTGSISPAVLAVIKNFISK